MAEIIKVLKESDGKMVDVIPVTKVQTLHGKMVSIPPTISTHTAAREQSKIVKEQLEAEKKTK